MKLPIELVPASCWYSNVRSNVSPATWVRLRHQIVTITGQRCEVCGRAGTGHPVECHETWGYDDARWIQRLEGLVALCPDCHLVKHFGRAIVQHRTRYALSWFASINELTPAQALAHAKHAIELHAQRSQHAWALDLSLLSKRYGIRLDSNHQEAL